MVYHHQPQPHHQAAQSTHIPLHPQPQPSAVIVENIELQPFNQLNCGVPGTDQDTTPHAPIVTEYACAVTTSAALYWYQPPQPHQLPPALDFPPAHHPHITRTETVAGKALLTGIGLLGSVTKLTRQARFIITKNTLGQ